METVVLGPGDIDQAHQPDEYLALDRIPPTLDLLKSLIRRFCIDA
jgi:acetylornithine deacetylase